MFTTAVHPIDQYRYISAMTSVMQANPHQLVLLLYDGAIAAVLQARHALATGDTQTRLRTVSKAMRIIDEGLKIAVESRDDAALAANMQALYDHMVQRLLQANLHQSDQALDEVGRLLGELRSAWVEITPAGSPHASFQS